MRVLKFAQLIDLVFTDWFRYKATMFGDTTATTV